ALHPGNYETFQQRSEAYRRLGQFENAAEDLKAVIRLNPFQSDACFDLAWLYLTGPDEWRSPEKALPYARKAVELEPHVQSTVSLLGQVYFRLGKFDEALKTLENDLQVDDEFFKAGDWLFLAIIHQRRGDPATANTYYRQALRWQQAPEHPPSNSQ